MKSRKIYIVLFLILLNSGFLFGEDKEIDVSIFVDSKEISSFTSSKIHTPNPVGLAIDEQERLIFFDMPMDKEYSGYLISADTITDSTAFSLIATVEQISAATNKQGIRVVDIDVMKDDSIIIASNGDSGQFNGLVRVSQGFSPTIKVVTEIAGITGICVDRKATPNVIYLAIGEKIHSISMNGENKNIEEYFIADCPIADIALDNDGNLIIVYADETLNIDKVLKDKTKVTVVDDAAVRKIDDFMKENLAITVDKAENSIYVYCHKENEQGKLIGLYIKFDEAGSFLFKMTDEDIRKVEDFEGMKNQKELTVTPVAKGMVVDAIGNLLIADGIKNGEVKEEMKLKHTFSIISISEISTSATPWSAYK